METNIERQFFEVCPFISAAQQNLPDALTKRFPREVGLNSPPMAIKIPLRRLNRSQRMCDYVQAKHVRDKTITCICHVKSSGV